ncbi:hypothetical protein [Acidovorax sp. ACV01]|uniref:hypothetical protein n=1 Tax=Acidovorax sp. ACV01 TaxID=2769311 RepID=UPI001784D22F|nr:hypothetical protein [Acidovorax sp. ACV01]MBD9395348.1 hypothetical protein [Acidovorax sp. ACV01]
MSNATVVKRVVRGSPHRDSVETWDFIVELLTQGKSGPKRDELLSVAGVASSILTEMAPEDAAIVVECKGPRTRIYCLYDEDAIDGSDAKEDALGHDPLEGEWAISLPCPKDDLAWVERALKAKSKRITARDMTSKFGTESTEDSKKASADFSFDTSEFLKS